jgi:tripeptidyl-peptidase-1
MKLSTSILALTALLTPSLASLVNTRSPYAVKGSHPVPPRWERLDRAHPDHPIELRIGLKQSEFDELERQLYESKF